MTIHTRAAVALAALLAATFPVQAQKPPASAAAPSLKIGFINTTALLDNSSASKQAVRDLEAEFKRREEEIAKGPANLVERRRATLNEEMAAKRDEALKKLLERANAEVKRIAEAENLDIVLSEAVFVSPRVDITPRVIKALDSRK